MIIYIDTEGDAFTPYFAELMSLLMNYDYLSHNIRPQFIINGIISATKALLM